LGCEKGDFLLILQRVLGNRVGDGRELRIPDPVVVGVGERFQVHREGMALVVQFEGAYQVSLEECNCQEVDVGVLDLEPASLFD
jgi:hypothetical protein